MKKALALSVLLLSSTPAYAKGVYGPVSNDVTDVAARKNQSFQLPIKSGDLQKYKEESRWRLSEQVSIGFVSNNQIRRGVYEWRYKKISFGLVFIQPF